MYSFENRTEIEFGVYGKKRRNSKVHWNLKYEHLTFKKSPSGVENSSIELAVLKIPILRRYCVSSYSGSYFVQGIKLSFRMKSQIPSIGGFSPSLKESMCHCFIFESVKNHITVTG